MDTPILSKRRTFSGTQPKPLGTAVPMRGRVRECADLLGDYRPPLAGEGGVGALLDVGCYSGWLAEVALRKGFREYVGLDRHIDGTGAPRPGARYLEGSAFALPFDDRSFDAVTLFDVIQELPRDSEPAALREAHRVLRPGGILYLSTPHASLIHTPLDPVWFMGQRHYRRATIGRFLTSSGFAIERMFVAGGIAECLSQLRLWLYGHLAHRNPPAAPWIDHLIERDHGKARRLGQTIFVAARRPPA